MQSRAGLEGPPRPPRLGFERSPVPLAHEPRPGSLQRAVVSLSLGEGRLAGNRYYLSSCWCTKAVFSPRSLSWVCGDPCLFPRQL